jgi:hypothetical protein
MEYSGPDLESFVAQEWSETLPHEIAHVMLAADFFPEEAAGVPGRYGTPLPDWFDEAVAIWAEPDSVREARLAQARRHLQKIPALAELQGYVHPLRDDPASRSRTVTLYPCPRAELCPARPRWQEAMRVTTWIDRVGQEHADTVYYPGMPPEENPAAEHFYPLALAMLQYVWDRGGHTAVDALEQRLRAEPNAREPLLGLPGLPRDPETLEADWRRWWGV